MSTNKLLLELQKRGVEVKYRESIYKAVEKLVVIGLAKKGYDSSRKSIVYSLCVDHIEVDLRKGEVSIK